MLDDVLEYSRLESRNVTLAFAPTSGRAWAERSADMMRWRVDEKNLNLKLELACPPRCACRSVRCARGRSC
ncbi:hypothetical protein WS46_00490 [Burkholderia sp. RF4-BP95]|nr:hypothetical protein WS46_00490 [Burkholderia sp. RF4-BP95]